MTDTHTTRPSDDQEAVRRMVQNEIDANVSGLVHTLANGYGRGFSDGHSELPELCELAFELSTPVPDYEEAAIQAGWEQFTDEFGVNCYRDTSDGQTWAAASWEDLCRDQDIEPHEREVFEHWIVSNWLADKLEAHGEKVERDFAGLTIWARTTTGQAILLDRVICDIFDELHSNS